MSDSLDRRSLQGRGIVVLVVFLLRRILDTDLYEFEYIIELSMNITNDVDGSFELNEIIFFCQNFDSFFAYIY